MDIREINLDHIAAIKKLGPCEIHRRTFIRNFVKEAPEDAE